MDELSQARFIAEQAKKDIESFKACYWTEQDVNSTWYYKELEKLYIQRTKAELNLRKLELRAV